VGSSVPVLIIFWLFDLKLDYERKEREWNKILRSSADDWGRNMDTIINWSPYSSEAELLEQVIIPSFSNCKTNGAFLLYQMNPK